MKTETHAVAMTDPQLSNSNANNNNNTTNTNNNNDGEPKYLHKKFKKVATTEVATRPVDDNGPVANDVQKDCKENSKTDAPEHEPETETVTNETGKKNYLCPYCKLSCAKPSVLQKHIRAHTNERPYPCLPCGFAFKTKSNLYKHCRSRAHILKLEEGDSNKISEDSDISMSDSASNGTGTPPPGLNLIPNSLTSTPISSNSTTPLAKTVKTGKIYKPKFHTALQNVANHEDTNVNSGSFSAKPNPEQVQEHIDRIITDNQAIVEAVDPRLHKLMLRQAEAKQGEQPLNLSTEETPAGPSRKRSHPDNLAQQNGKDGDVPTSSDHDESENDNFVCPACNIAYSSADNLGAHQRFYCKGTPGSCPRKANFHLDLEKREDADAKSDYYNGLQPLPSPGPLLGNTRLVDAYASSSPKKPRTESVPTSLRSLEELSKYPRPNSLQMFGGEVRILDHSGETKTMRIDPCQAKSPTPGEQSQQHGKCPTSSGTTSVLVRSGLHSGGMMVHKSPLGEGAATSSSSMTLTNAPKILAPIVPNISKPNLAPTLSCYSNYLESHINPLTSITAYNPLTLPQAGIASILHAGKYIPYVPGMPGPHSLTEAPAVDISPNLLGEPNYKVMAGMPGLHVMPQPLDLASPVPKPSSGQPLDLVSPAKEAKQGFHANSVSKPEEKISARNNHHRSSVSPIEVAPKNYKLTSTPEVWDKRDTFYRDPSPKVDLNGLSAEAQRTSPFAKAVKFSPRVIASENPRKRPANWPIDDGERTKNEMELPKTVESGVVESFDRPKTPEDVSKMETSTKFLRPTSLPLKPGTFVPKKNLGITPTSNTIPPLISPETPRPKKSYGQLYLNGHAYTYLGMKCSTRLFYCTLNRPQPMYVLHQHGLSMYSNWKINTESPTDSDMANYDSRNRHSRYSAATIKLEFTMTHSSHRPATPTSQANSIQENDNQEKTKKVKICDGGFESNEDYTYVRGRGRGRYVCNSCGIRCKKPSMLKKHIRTHTDVRPYTCKHCSFSFKTKGNLTKHMKSKAHYKKCVELNIVPVPTVVTDDNIDKEAIARLAACGENGEESSDEEEESEGEESEEQESGNEEQEAAQSLLSLSQPNATLKNVPGLLPSGRPLFYPYKHNLPSFTALTSSVTCTTSQSTTCTSSVQSATVIQSDHANRYYFPSSRNVPDELKTSVSADGVVEEKVETGETRSATGSQPMDLTTRQVVASPIPQRAKPADILTPVSEPVLLQTIVQSMERLPIQGTREWKPEAQEGHMLQAYLTERHVMDSKIKQQYRVGNSKPGKPQKEKDLYLKQSATISRPNEMNGVITVSYTSQTKMHPTFYDSRLKNRAGAEDVNAEAKVYAQFDLKQKKEPRLENPKPPFFERSNYPGDLTRPAELEPAKKSYGLLVPANCHLPTTASQDANSENRPNPPVSVQPVHRISNSEYSKVIHNADARNLYRPDPATNFGLMSNQNSSERSVTESEPSNDVSLAIKHSVARKMVVGSPGFRPETPPVVNNKPQAIVKPHFLQNSTSPAPNYVSVTEDGRSVCGICNKVFSKSSQLKLHINIHYFERPFKCESCGVSFRTKGHLTKHERSVSHHNKVSMTSTFGTATTSNPRPFKCGDCKVAFRIHGHLAKHLRSKMHIMRLECLGKLPFGCYAEMERSGVNLNDIDTTDCDNSLTSLQMLAQRMYENDPSKVKSWDAEASRNQAVSGGETSSDEGEALPLNSRLFNISEENSTNSQCPTSPGTNISLTENGDASGSLARCQICAISFPSLSDLQMHNFVEHNKKADQENTQKDKPCENT